MSRPVLRAVVLLMLAACLALGPTAIAGAGGGGGCHSQTTTDGTGTEVALVGNCFGPTILRVPVGTTVTWHNRDTYEHTVTAAAGLFDAVLSFGKEATFRFTRAGVYPYYCQYHVRMAGAVVVGDGADTTSAAGAPVVPAAKVIPEPRQEQTFGSSTALLALAAGVGGIMIGNAPRIARRVRARS